MSLNAAKHATIVHQQQQHDSNNSRNGTLTLLDFVVVFCISFFVISYLYFIFSILVSFTRHLQLPEEKSPQHPVELSTELMLACTEALSSSYVKKNTHPKVPERLPDMIKWVQKQNQNQNQKKSRSKNKENKRNAQSEHTQTRASRGNGASSKNCDVRKLRVRVCASSDSRISVCVCVCSGACLCCVRAWQLVCGGCCCYICLCVCALHGQWL